MSPNVKPRFIIIGAGITGLVLAQALRKDGVPFEIFERDPHAEFRGKGWGLTIHWALEQFLALLPEDIKDRLEEVYVNPLASKNGENGNFLFFDLQSGEARWQVPAQKRMRVSRERLRKLLMTGIDVQWGKSFTGAEDAGAEGITARFEDGHTVTGSQVIGCDGSRSNVREWLCPSSGRNDILPFRMLGVTAEYPRAIAQPMRDIDPFFMQGGDPATDSFMYFSFLSTPKEQDPLPGEDNYQCQIILSWPYRSGYLGSETPIEVPTENSDRIALMKKISKGWAEPFRTMVQNIPVDNPAKSISIEEWIPQEGAWDNRTGKVTLIGDAAHTMTMYRGEAANHGIADIAEFMVHYKSSWASPSSPPSSAFNAAEACNAYEREMIKRNSRAVRVSTRAVEDAHIYSRINDSSPLVNKRVIDA